MSDSKFDVYAGSDVGRVRSRNEDSFLVDSEQRMFAVADGMGGHGGGDEASRSAVEKLQEDFTSIALEHSFPDFKQSLIEIVNNVNQNVFARNAERGSDNGSGMGTTLVGIALSESMDSGIIFNVGDSRVYLCRDGKLEQLTRDQTVYQNWLESGRCGPEPTKNLILQAIGLYNEVEVDMGDLAVQHEDTLLLCSDGLSGSLTDKAIEKLLNDHASDTAEHTVERLIYEANMAGGEDNITVVLVKLNTK